MYEDLHYFIFKIRNIKKSLILQSITHEAKDGGVQFDLSALERLLQDTPTSPSNKSKLVAFYHILLKLHILWLKN